MLGVAIRFIRFDKAKSIGVTIGIVISTFLIGQQLGIFTFLTGLMSALVDNSGGDVWVVDSKTRNANSLGRLDIRKVREIKSIEGVAEAYPIVLGSGQAVFADGTTAPVTLVGSEAPTLKAGPNPAKIIGGSLSRLFDEATLSADYYEAKNLGGTTAPGTTFEINGKRAVIGVQTRGLRGFGASFMYTGIERARYYANLPDNVISAVVVTARPGYTAEQVRNNINASIYGVRAWVRQDFSRATVGFILGNSGIGASTGTLIVFAVIAGFFIIGLTMYSSALDRIRDYGTLKAIGASNGYIRRLILTQAALFAVVGFAIAYALLEGFRRGAQGTGLVFQFSTYQTLAIFGVTLFIALFGAVFAVRRITGLEPAAVFR